MLSWAQARAIQTGEKWWAWQGLNLRPLRCQGRHLPDFSWKTNVLAGACSDGHASDAGNRRRFYRTFTAASHECPPESISSGSGRKQPVRFSAKVVGSRLTVAACNTAAWQGLSQILCCLPFYDLAQQRCYGQGWLCASPACMADITTSANFWQAQALALFQRSSLLAPLF